MDIESIMLKTSFKSIRKLIVPNLVVIIIYLIPSYLTGFAQVFILAVGSIVAIQVIPSIVALGQYLYYNYKMVVKINSNEIHINDRIIDKNEVESVVLRITANHLSGAYIAPLDKCNYFLITLKTGEKIYLTSLLYYDFQKVLDSFSAYNCTVKKALPFIY